MDNVSTVKETAYEQGLIKGKELQKVILDVV